MSEQPCAFHPDRLTGVSCSRCERPICPDDMFPAAVGIHCTICAGKMREGALGQAGYRARTRAERLPFARAVVRAEMTSVILGANVIVFVLMLFSGSPSAPTLARFGALIRPLESSEWWRLFTSMFVHIGFVHLLFNMMGLVVFGRTLEERYGKIRFLALYLVGGLLGSATSLAFSGAGLGAGASGAIFAILGVWIAVAAIHRGHPAMKGQLQSLLFLLAINASIGIAVPRIDLYAHVGGLLGGIAIGAALELSAKVTGIARAVVGSAGYLAVVIASLLLAGPRMV